MGLEIPATEFLRLEPGLYKQPRAASPSSGVFAMMPGSLIEAQRAGGACISDFNQQKLANTASTFAATSQNDFPMFAELAAVTPNVWHGRLPQMHACPSPSFWTCFSMIFKIGFVRIWDLILGSRNGRNDSCRAKRVLAELKVEYWGATG